MRRRRRKQVQLALLKARHGKMYEWNIANTVEMHKGLHKEEIDVVASLKACARKKNLLEGCKIHGHVIEMGFLEKNIFIGSALVSMYAKCAALTMAQELFDKLLVPDVVSWTALIGGYAQYGCGNEALDCFKRMQCEGLFPNAVTFCCILKACGSIRASHKGKEIHAEIAHVRLFTGNVILGTALVDMYAKCGQLMDARQVFDELLEKDVVSWTALMTGYVQHGLSKEALKCFEQMQQRGISPNAMTFACILQACGNIGANEKGEEIHLEILKENLLGKDNVLGTALVDMYAKCGQIVKAQDVFDNLPVHNIVSYSVLITGYCLNGYGEEALHRFEKMQQEGIFPNAVTLASILKACGSIRETRKGREIHAEIARRGLWEVDCVLDNSLIEMYMKCNALTIAHELFNELSVQNLVSWNILISGHYLHGHCKEALDFYRQMQMEGQFPDEVTFRCVLQVCSDIGARMKGKELHVQILGGGFLGVLGIALMNMYVKCGAVVSAKAVFDELIARDAGWNALIVGYCDLEYGEEALDCFRRMVVEGFYWDAITFASVLKACGILRAPQMGREIHSLVVIEGWLEKDIVLGTAVVDMYIRCGLLEIAQQVFNELPILDKVSWTAVISAYSRHGHSVEALDCFNQMQFEGLSPDAVTFSSILKVCSSIGALEKGEEIHANIVRNGILGKDSVLGVGLVHMYARCNALLKAEQVFNMLPIQDVVSWTALIAGYAQNGEHETVFKLFNKMVGEGIKPNLVTFIVILNACSFLGLLDKGRMYFETMGVSYGICPTLEHHTCIVDLLGRIGYIESAMKAIQAMPSCNHLPMWFSLLGASEKWGNVQLGRLVFNHVVQLDKSGNRSGLAYTYMNNILCTFW